MAIIRAFAGERNEVNTVDGETYEFDHDACRAVDSFQVLDADSSQQDAIALSQKGVMVGNQFRYLARKP